MRREDITAEQIIEKLGMVPLTQEGGMVLEAYKSKARTDAGKMAGSAIYFLLRDQAFSSLHRLAGDEMYHFYLGDPVELTELLPDGSVKTTVLGSGILDGECVQHLVPAGNWQGSRLKDGGSWALLGTTMCPGYTDDIYEHGDRDSLIREYPSAADEILRLTGDPVY
ncbi:MAG: cupin domain-containing protein [Eubacterium sp.]|nr:cupin domain-containing protein [Eubacterium sp.]